MSSFSCLNLRFNPFGELDTEERKQLACVRVADLANYVGSPKTAIQLLGNHGRGKTTHLLALHAHFPEIPYFKIHSGQLISFPKSKGYFIDSIENISLVNRLLLYREIKHLAFTTHKNLNLELKLMGFHVVTRRISQNDPEIIRTILQKRVEFSRETSKPIPVITLTMANELVGRFGDDIRAMEYELYQYFNSLRTSEEKQCQNARSI